MTHKRLVALALLIVCLGTGLMLFSARSSSQTKTSKQSEKNEKIPVADLGTEQQLSADETRLRKSRSSKFETKESLQELEAELKNDNTVILDLPFSHAPKQHALPVQQSDAIVIGTVSDARAVLFPDNSNAYCEFTIKIESTLKNLTSYSLVPDTTITAERLGGIIRFPSGKTLRRGILGQGYPETGSKYLLFLKWDETGKDFPIITGYRLEGGKVLPLDGVRKGGELDIYSEYKSFKGKDEEYLLQLLNQALAKWSGEVTNK